jgi:hypothetical protein
MKSFLTATAILLAIGTVPALAQSSNGAAGTSSSNGAGTDSTSSGGQYTGDGIAGTSNGGGTAGTASFGRKSPDYDSTAAKRRNSINGGQASSPTVRTMSQGPNGTPRIQEGRSDNSQGFYQPKTPP